MPTPWPIDVRQRNPQTLFVFPTGELERAPTWGRNLFLKIIAEFNALKLGVTMNVSKEAPDPNGSGGGADVQMSVSSGTHKFNFLGERTGSLNPPPNINGKTHPAIQGGEIQKSFVFVPINPTISQGGRTVGRGVLIYIALHELLHACGLRESDAGHLPNGTPDIFMSGGSLSASFPPEGVPGDPQKTGDRVDFGSGVFAPPFLVNSRTRGLITANWQP